jgi:hypothetical protein
VPLLAGEYVGLLTRNAAECAGSEDLQPTGWALLAMFDRPLRSADR